MTHRHRIRSLTALLGSAAIAVIAGVAPAAAHRAANATPVAAQTGRLITLVTGERILESTGPDGRVAFSEASTATASPLLTFEANATWYAVPAVVMHSLGGQLDPALFDTAALTEAESGAPSSVPVQVQWQGAAAPAMPWLLHQVAASPGVTDGVVTNTSGAVLESALAAGPLPGVDRVSLKGAMTSPRRATAGFSLYTLTVNGIDAAGTPDTGDAAILINTDNAINSAGVGFEQWYHGVFKVSVPDGHYALLGDFVAFSNSGAVNGGGPPLRGTERMAIVNFTVHGNTTVTVDARAATARLAVTTPHPTDVGSGVATWQRDSKGTTGGTSFSSLWSFGGGAPPFSVFVSPTPAPSVGTQAWVVNYHLDSPATAAAAYSYDLSFGDLGAISANQRENVKVSHLATIATTYYSDVTDLPTLELRQSFFPWQFAAIGEFELVQCATQTHRIRACGTGPGLGPADHRRRGHLPGRCRGTRTGCSRAERCRARIGIADRSAQASPSTPVQCSCPRAARPAPRLEHSSSRSSRSVTTRPDISGSRTNPSQVSPRPTRTRSSATER